MSGRDGQVHLIHAEVRALRAEPAATLAPGFDMSAVMARSTSFTQKYAPSVQNLHTLAPGFDMSGRDGQVHLLHAGVRALHAIPAHPSTTLRHGGSMTDRLILLSTVQSSNYIKVQISHATIFQFIFNLQVSLATVSEVAGS